MSLEFSALRISYLDFWGISIGQVCMMNVAGVSLLKQIFQQRHTFMYSYEQWGWGGG